ncbi:hypothetical protein [Cupriavidus sp. 8B]
MKVNLADLAEQCGAHRNTVSDQNAKLKLWIEGERAKKGGQRAFCLFRSPPGSRLAGFLLWARRTCYAKSPKRSGSSGIVHLMDSSLRSTACFGGGNVVCGANVVIS